MKWSLTTYTLRVLHLPLESAKYGKKGNKMIDYSAEYIVKDFQVSETKNGNKLGKLYLENTKNKEI